jgi:hypothetical protein
VYWLGIYMLVATPIFAVAGLFILIGFVWCELKVRLRRARKPQIHPESRRFRDSLYEPHIAFRLYRDIQ